MFVIQNHKPNENMSVAPTDPSENSRSASTNISLVMELDDVESLDGVAISGYRKYSEHCDDEFYCADGRNNVMPTDRYAEWLNAVSQHRLKKMKRTLNEAGSSSEKDRLLNGLFLARNVEDARTLFGPHIIPEVLNEIIESELKLTHGKGVRIFFPLQIAIMTGFRDGVQLLLENGADPATSGCYGWNAVHCLAMLSTWDSGTSSAIYRDICKHVMRQPKGTETLRAMLTSEDTSGFRPLELAMKLAGFELADLIFRTENVYKFTKSAVGFNEYALFDITDYLLTGDRYLKRPYRLTTRLKYSQLSSGQIKEQFLESPLQQWFRAHRKHYTALYLLWLAYRVIYIALFMMFMQDFLVNEFHSLRKNLMFSAYMAQENSSNHGNTTEESFNMSCKIDPSFNFDSVSYSIVIRLLLYIRLASNLAAVVIDGYGECKSWKYLRPVFPPEKRSDYIVSIGFYVVCDYLHNVCAIISFEILSHTDVFDSNRQVLRTVVYICIAFASIFNVWSLLFFLKQFPVLGYFVIIFQEMVMSLVNFLAIYMVIWLSFSVTFYALIGSQCLHREFLTMWGSMYATFTMMLNMVSMVNDEVDIDSAEGTILVVLHFVYVFVVAILLLNFLIAVMSGTVLRVAEHKHIITELHRIHTYGLIEWRLSPVLSKIWPRNKAYVYKNGRVYFPCLVLVTLDSLGDDDDGDEGREKVQEKESPNEREHNETVTN